MMRPGQALALLLTSLALGCSRSPSAEVSAEIARREAFARAVAIDAGASRLWGVSNRSEIHFEDGFALPTFSPEGDFRNHAFRWMGQRGRVRLKTHGDHPMRIRMEGWLDEKVIRSKGVVNLYVAGAQVGSTGAIESGNYGIEVVVPSDVLNGADWIDLDVTVSAVAFYWAEAPELRVALLTKLEWEEAP